jgi:hypothetical protein
MSSRRPNLNEAFYCINTLVFATTFNDECRFLPVMYLPDLCRYPLKPVSTVLQRTAITREMRNVHTILVSKTARGATSWEKQWVDGKKILKWILKNWV